MLDVHFACGQILWTGKVADLLLNGRSPRLATGFNGGARRHDQVSICEQHPNIIGPHFPKRRQLILPARCLVLPVRLCNY